MLFGIDPENRPSVKKILIYCVVIVAVVLLIGYAGERLGLNSII